jgi:hypothetical protein
MTAPLILTLRSDDPALRREIERGLEGYADVRQAPNYADPETVKLVLDIVAQGVSIAGGVAGIVTFVRSLKQAKAEQGITVNVTVEAPGQPPQSIEEADAELLARLLGAGE